MGVRIGIDALFIRPGGIGGTESYLRNLLKGLEKVDYENEYYIFVSRTNFETFKFDNKNFNVVVCDIDNTKKINRIIYTSRTLPKLIKNNLINVMFFPTYVRCFRNIKGVKIVSNVHDIQYKHFPENFPFSKRILFKLVYPISLRKSDKNICISNFVKYDIKDNFKHINLDKFQVIYNPIDFKKFDIKHNANFNELEKKLNITSKNYILSVASLYPHKNISTLIKAFNIYKKNTGNNIKLVLVGVKESFTENIYKLIEEEELTENIIVPGFVSDQELNLLYNNASIFVCTSLFEGFGMPPVEAMYRELPVITTKCASLPEVTMNKAIYYNNPLDENELATVIYDTIKGKVYCTNDLKDELIKRYSLENIGKKYKEMFENITMI